MKVLISPIGRILSDGAKRLLRMSLLHSFYCWGMWRDSDFDCIFCHCRIENWRILAVILGNPSGVECSIFLEWYRFRQKEDVEEFLCENYLKMKIFWVLVLLMMRAGASEQGMSRSGRQHLQNQGCM